MIIKLEAQVTLNSNTSLTVYFSYVVVDEFSENDQLSSKLCVTGRDICFIEALCVDGIEPECRTSYISTMMSLSAICY